MTHGDLHWVNLPDRGGHEQRGRRPGVIWQDTDQFALPTVLVIPLTSKQSAARFAGTVPLQPSGTNGLTLPSFALVFQLGSWDVRRVEGRIGRLDDEDLKAVAEMARRIQKLG
jgi:mRNA interferase MazF